jgi:hypothetical protein
MINLEKDIIRQKIHQTLSGIDESLIKKQPVPNESILLNLINKVDSYWYMGIFNYAIATSIAENYPNFMNLLIEKIEPLQFKEHLDHILNRSYSQNIHFPILEALYYKMDKEDKKKITKNLQYEPLFELFIKNNYDLNDYEKALKLIKKEKVKIDKKVFESLDPYSFSHNDTVDTLKNRLNAHYEILGLFHNFNLSRHFKEMKKNIPTAYGFEKIALMKEFHTLIEFFYDNKLAQKEKEHLENTLLNTPNVNKKIKI